MISGETQKHSKFAPNRSLDRMRGNELGFQAAIERKLMSLAIGFATAGVIMTATATVAQSATSISTTTQHSTCTADTQGLMCNSGAREFESSTIQTSQAATSTASWSQPLSNAQMEHLSDILLGLLYFVLPSGFGVLLFWHDRNQAQRTATLEAQIKLLEKLWEQTPQA